VAGGREIGRRWIILLYRGYDDLRARLNALVSQGRLEDLELPIEGMCHRLAIGAAVAVRVVEEERFNHLLLFDSEL
jgi:hypothetical protein